MNGPRSRYLDPCVVHFHSRPVGVFLTALLAQWLALKLYLFFLITRPDPFREDIIAQLACLTVGIQWYMIFWPGKVSARLRAGGLHTLCTVPLLLLYIFSVAVGSYYYPAAYTSLTFWGWLWRI